MTPAKLRADATDVLLSLGTGDHPSTAAIQRAAKDRVNDLSGYTCDAVIVDLARAALALAELMPVLEAFADEWAKPNAHAVTLHAPGFSVAVVDLLVALGKAKESLQ